MVLDFFGGSRCSAESTTALLRYMEGSVGDLRPGLTGAVPGRSGAVNERAEFWRAVCGRALGDESSETAFWVPELRRMCGGPEPRGDSGDDMVSECIG